MESQTASKLAGSNSTVLRTNPLICKLLQQGNGPPETIFLYLAFLYLLIEFLAMLFTLLPKSPFFDVNYSTVKVTGVKFHYNSMFRSSNTAFQYCKNKPLFSSASKSKKWYFVTKIVLTYCEKNCSSDQENLWKFDAEG